MRMYQLREKLPNGVKYVDSDSDDEDFSADEASEWSGGDEGSDNEDVAHLSASSMQGKVKERYFIFALFFEIL